MVSQTGLLIVFLIIFIAFFIIVSVYYIQAPPPNKPPDPNSFTSKYDSFVIWGEEIPVDGNRGYCNKYDFPATLSPVIYPCPPSIGNAHPGIAGQISLDANVLDKLTPITQGACEDIDQIVAKKVTRTCTGLDTNSTATCSGVDGKQYRVGETETLYTTENCGVTSCASELVFWGVGYSVIPDVPICNGIKCLKSNSDKTVTGVVCDMADPLELYRLNRYTILGKKATNGILAKIEDREKGLCLTVNSNNTGLKLDTCGEPVWALFPALKGTIYASSQQTAYIGNLSTFELIDILNSDTIDDVMLKISSYGVLSIQLNVNGDVTLLPYAFYMITSLPSEDQIRRTTSQFINYTLYNTILFSKTPFVF